MNVFGWVLLLAVTVVAGADGWQAARHRGPAPALGLTVSAILLGAFAWLAHAETTGAGQLLLVGLLLTVGASVLLARRRVTGAGAALAWGAAGAARLVLGAAVVALPSADGLRVPTGWGLVALVAIASGALLLWRLRRLGGDPGQRGAVTAYGVVALGVAGVAAWLGGPLATAGLLVLAAGDAGVAWSWLSRRTPPGAVPVVTVVLRHLGLGLVVVGVVRPDLVG